MRGIAALGVDFKPLAVRRWQELGLNPEFGDATDSEFIAGLPIRATKWVVSTIPIHPTGLSYEDVKPLLSRSPARLVTRDGLW